MKREALDQFLAKQTSGDDRASIPGVVALGTSATETLYEGAFGSVDIETPYSIMSMTKPITSFAIMQLVESGQVDLDTPATEYLPKYRDMSVLQQVDQANKTYTTEPLEHPFTVRHLLTHTAGFGYSFCNASLFALRPDADRADFPLSHQPGERWTYGVSTRLLGEIVAAVTGNDLGTALRQMIFEPLGMADTSFEQRDNQVYLHRQVDNRWQAGERGAAFPFGDGGLVSTAGDYAKFLRCLLQEGAPLLPAPTFRSMISNQIGDLCISTQPGANPIMSHDFPTGGGIDKFGFGFQIHQAPDPGLRSPGSYSWCGLYNTYFWGDPVKKVGGIVLMQLLPLYEPVCLDTLSGFEQRFYTALN